MNNMKKIQAILLIAVSILILSACTKKETIDTSLASPEIKEGVQKSFDLSTELTAMQVDAIKDGIIDTAEIAIITDKFGTLAILNNYNKATYGEDKFFIALVKEYKEQYDSLAKELKVVKDCKGYDDLWLSIQTKSLEVKDVKVIPAPQEALPVDTPGVTEGGEEVQQ